MSIFSRLFNKNPESDGKEPTEDDEGGSSREGERMRKPSFPSPDPAPREGRGSMRPEAPSFQINAPPAAASIPVAAVPIVQVGDPRSERAPAPNWPAPSEKRGPALPAAATAPAPREAVETATLDRRSDVRPRPVGAATIKMGTHTAATLPTNSSAGKGAVPVAAGQGPLPSSAVTATGGFGPGRPAAAAPQARPAPVRPKLTKDFGEPKVQTPARSSEPSRDSVDDLLTLELGSSSSMEAQAKRGLASNQPTAQGLAPAAAVAHAWAARQGEGSGVSPNVESDHSLFNDLDAAFGAIVDSAHAERPGAPKTSALGSPVGELRELFTALAVSHMRQVRDFMIAVKWGEAPSDWVPICEPAVSSLHRAAKEMELGDLCDSLDGYAVALRKVAENGTGTVSGMSRDLLMAAYAELTQKMPDAFGLDGERGQREAIIVHALLQQVPEVRKVTIDKIYAAGLTSLDTLFLAKPDEISATTGIGENVASSIVAKFQHYRREIAALADATRAAERRRLSELAREMRDLHERFDRADSEWSEDAQKEKKRARHARAEVLLQVKVLLARLGEVDRLGQIERLPFGRKIDELEAYLRETQMSEARA